MNPTTGGCREHGAGYGCKPEEAPVRIGLIIYGTLDTLSGGFLYDRMLVKHLRARGDEVIVYTLPWRNYPRHLLDNLSTGLFKRIRQAHPDILLQDELNHPSLVLPNRRLKRQMPAPVVSIVHHLRCRERRPAHLNAFYRAVEKAYLHTVDAFVFNSEATRASVEHLTGQRKPWVTATPGGDRLGALEDPGRIEARCRAAGPLQLLFVGNVIPRKGLVGLLDALARIRDVEWQLKIVGALDVDPAYATRVRTRVRQSGLGHRVAFCGAAGGDSLGEFYRSAHLVALPFSYEGFGIVFLEGMAFGLPALACREGGAGEIVRHGESGHLFAPGAADELAGVLRRLAGDREELLRLSLAARKRFDAFPGWRESAQSIRTFLRSLVKT